MCPVDLCRGGGGINSFDSPILIRLWIYENHCPPLMSFLTSVWNMSPLKFAHVLKRFIINRKWSTKLKISFFFFFCKLCSGRSLKKNYVNYIQLNITYGVFELQSCDIMVTCLQKTSKLQLRMANIKVTSWESPFGPCSRHQKKSLAPHFWQNHLCVSCLLLSITLSTGACIRKDWRHWSMENMCPH